MIESEAFAVEAATVAEVRGYLRIDPGSGPGQAEEDRVIATLIAGALEACEAAIGAAPVVRTYRERVTGGAAWTRLTARPVRAITGVSRGGVPLAGDTHEVDIDADGRGRVRLLSGASVVEVTYAAGLAASWTSMHLALKLGVLKAVAAWQAGREAGTREASRVVPDEALSRWRPYRRLGLGR